MSALPPKVDIAEGLWHVRFVPKADICSAAKIPLFDPPIRAERGMKPVRSPRLLRISLKSYGKPRQLRCRCRFRNRIKCGGHGLNRCIRLMTQPMPICEPVRIVVGKPCGPRCVLPDQRL